ncbi:MAG: hypothetical protein HYR91_10525 [Flavobacteriia bacterium]|nr:hypothetical protein [Flavobacteriia bacterium]
MRSELNILEKIDAYINHSMSSSERILFQKEIEASPEIKKTIEIQKLIAQAVIRKNIKAQVQSFAPVIHSKITFWNKYKLPIIFSSFTILLITAISIINHFSTAHSIENSSRNKTFIIKNKPLSITQSSVTKNVKKEVISFKKDSIPSNNTGVKNILTSLVQQKKSVDHKNPFIENEKDLDGLKPWINVKSQHYQIDTETGKTIICNEGTLIVIPKNAFCDKFGKNITGIIDLEIIEALDMADMIAYNLTTTANNNALQSGGMIYIQPRINGEKMFISPEKPIHIEIPTKKYNAQMLAWKGEVNSDGNINWTNPKQLDKFLIPIDFKTLDFLPDGFKNAVKTILPYHNHTKATDELVDSLYYALSTEGLQKAYDLELPIKVDFSNKTTLKKDRFFHKWSSRYFINQIDLRQNHAFKILNLTPNEIQTATIKVQAGKTNITPSIDQSGIVYFPINTIKTFKNINISIQTICSNIIIYKNIKLKRKKINTLSFTGKKCMINESINSTSQSNQIVSKHCYIDPIIIKTIKSTIYKNTFIATKEFEERLKQLHKIPNGEIYLNLYIQNLNKNLFEIDQLISNQIDTKYKAIFQEFANQKCTNIDNNDVNIAELKNFYNKTRNQYQQEIERNQAIYNKLNNQQMNFIENKINTLNSLFKTQTFSRQSFQKATTIEKESYGNENTINITILPISQTPSYNVSWNSTGWMNIDAYLHLLSSGEKIVSIIPATEQGDQHIYQCINTLKTIIPLNQVNQKCEAHFPIEGNEGSLEMKDTYCVGIHKENNLLSYSEKCYNPYTISEIKLNWINVTEKELLEKLKYLSPSNDVLIQSMNNELVRLDKEKKQQEEYAKIQARINLINEKILFEQEIKNILINSINSCIDIGN